MQDEKAIVLEVDVGRFMDTSLIKADVQPLFVRLLIKGRLLQLTLPEEVRPDESSAQRSKVRVGPIDVSFDESSTALADAVPSDVYTKAKTPYLASIFAPAVALMPVAQHARPVSVRVAIEELQMLCLMRLQASGRLIVMMPKVKAKKGGNPMLAPPGALKAKKQGRPGAR